MNVQIIEQTGNKSHDQSEPDAKIKGMQRCQHIVAEKKTVAEIRMKVDQGKHKKEIKHKRDNINGSRARNSAQDEKVEKDTVGRKCDQGLDQLG